MYRVLNGANAEANGHDDYELYDSDTNDSLSAEDLGITEDEYRETVAESLACDQAEGHVYVGTRRVYAAE